MNCVKRFGLTNDGGREWRSHDGRYFTYSDGGSWLVFEADANGPTDDECKGAAPTLRAAADMIGWLREQATLPVVAYEPGGSVRFLADASDAASGSTVRPMTLDEVRSWVADGDCPDDVAALVKD